MNGKYNDLGFLSLSYFCILKNLKFIYIDKMFFMKQILIKKRIGALSYNGSNVASYKFALAKSLIDLGSNTNDLIKLEDLSIPYFTHVCEHLKNKPKQIIKKSIF